MLLGRRGAGSLPPGARASMRLDAGSLALGNKRVGPWGCQLAPLSSLGLGRLSRPPAQADLGSGAEVSLNAAQAACVAMFVRREL